ncbi:MAG TPA: class F sortase, partial [Candidatus Saccharimonadales bacterium]|nr:class F sortase [Candidatus Saccharimonadales bacterium]
MGHRRPHRQAQKADKIKQPQRWTLMTARGLQVLAVSLLLLGGARGLSDWVYDRAANQKAAQLIAAANNGTSHIAPSTTKPSQTAFEDYTVPALNPRYIYIPRLNITAIVRRLGTTPDNEIATPDNVYDAGWYQGSSRPGQPGA